MKNMTWDDFKEGDELSLLSDAECADVTGAGKIDIAKKVIKTTVKVVKTVVAVAGGALTVKEGVCVTTGKWCN